MEKGVYHSRDIGYHSSIFSTIWSNLVPNSRNNGIGCFGGFGGFEGFGGFGGFGGFDDCGGYETK